MANNPLFNMLGGSMPQMPGMMGDILRMKSEFDKFRSGFTGNAQQEVQRLLNSGQMSQQQFNQLQAMAQQFSHFLK